MNITPVRIYINGNGSISFYGPNNTLITNLQNLNGAKQSNGQIIFDGDDKTVSFYVYQLTSIESATFSLPYSVIDSRFFNPSAYSAKFNEVYQDVCEYVLVNKNGGASFVGGVVAVYPNYASFPATGQEAVIYIDEGTNQAYFWDGSAYQLLVSTGVEQYANFASFPVTGSANVIYIDMSVPEPYVWDGAVYVSLYGGTISWGEIVGTLSDQTDLQAALDAKFDNPTGTSSDYLDGTGTPTPFPGLTGFVPYTGATTNVDLGEYELKAGQLSLDTTPTGTAAVGTTQWNDTIGSSQTTLKGGSVVLKNGVDLVARVVNKVTPNTTLTKAAYQAVRVSGAQGQRLAVEFAQANNDNNSADTIGLVTETIATNQEGFIMTVGNLEEINTTGSLQGETWADGDVLYLSPTTPGALTNIKPTGLTGHIVVMGYVEYSHAIHGKIYVKIMNGWELDELHNVYINGPTTWQVLRYNGTTNLWVNDSLSASILPSGIDAAKIGAGTVDNTEFGYLNGVTSSIQTQIDGKVPTTRSLTINGTTYDLSADRTWTIATGLTVGTTPITSGTVGRVLFEGTGNVLQESANLFWDNTNSRLGIGTNSPSGSLQVVGGGIFSSSLNISGGFVMSEAGNVHTFTAPVTNRTIRFITNSQSYSIFPTGNFTIGTTTDAGFKLDVNGNTRITGSGATSATNGLTVLNSSLEEFLVVRNDGLIYSRGYNFWFSRQTATSAVANGSFLTGYRSSATGSYSFAANGGMEGIGGSSSATGNMSAVFGRNTNAYLTGQFAHSSYGFSQGGSQHSFVQLIRDIVGVSISELFINGSTLRATLPVANSIWVAKIYVNAVCNTAGGTTVLGAVFSGEYFVTVKRIGSTTTIVGTVSANEKSDASMSTSLVTIDADDTNDALRVQFTPPTTAGATTAIRVMANLHLTELRY